MALNTPIQGTSADIIKLAKIEVDRKLSPGFEKPFALAVHDDLILEVPGPNWKKWPGYCGMHGECLSA
jgi:DNA polymerase-1